MDDAQRDEHNNLAQPAFEVQVAGRVFKVYANGKTEGFQELDPGGPVIVINRIARARAS